MQIIYTSFMYRVVAHFLQRSIGHVSGISLPHGVARPGHLYFKALRDLYMCMLDET